MTNEAGTNRRRPPVFWLTIAAIVFTVASFAVGLARSTAERREPIMAGLVFALVIGLAITVTVIGAFVVQIHGRMRSAKMGLPDAFIVPIVVGPEMALATDRLALITGEASLRLKASTYAAIAVDGAAVHIIASATGSWGLVPASQVVFPGFTETMLGVRSVPAIVLRVVSAREITDLPITPIRVKGNLFSALKVVDITEVAGGLEAALRGVATGTYRF